jgi:hypothetical protein
MASRTMARASTPASSSLARTQLCMNVDVSRCEHLVMIGALSVVMICRRSGLAAPVSREMTSGSDADSAKNARKPSRNAAYTSPALP